MIETIGTIATAIAIIGVVANNCKLWLCFPLWMISNLLTAWIHWDSGINSLLVRDMVFMALAFHGLYVWKLKGTK